MQEAKLIVRSLLERGRLAGTDLLDEVRRLRRSVELSRTERGLHLADSPKRIFPGPFGRFMALLHAPFLDIELRTEEHEARWLHFVSYLDDLQEPPADHPFFQLARIEDEAAVAAFIEGQQEHICKLLDEDPVALASRREATIELLRTLERDPQARRSHAERLAASMDLREAISGSNDDAFNEHLAALNDDYRRYLTIGQRVREEAEREVGCRLDDPRLTDT